MNLHHTAALALIGWYLMMPPLRSNGTVDIHAPLSQWKISSSFDSANACETVKLSAQGYLPDPATGEKTVTHNAQLLNEACISTDDPRLTK